MTIKKTHNRVSVKGALVPFSTRISSSLQDEPTYDIVRRTEFVEGTSDYYSQNFYGDTLAFNLTTLKITKLETLSITQLNTMKI